MIFFGGSRHLTNSGILSTGQTHFQTLHMALQVGLIMESRAVVCVDMLLHFLGVD